MLRALLALLKEAGAGSPSPGVNPRELLVALGAFSAAVSWCKGVQWMGDRSGDTEIVSVKVGGSVVHPLHGKNGLNLL